MNKGRKLFLIIGALFLFSFIFYGCTIGFRGKRNINGSVEEDYLFYLEADCPETPEVDGSCDNITLK